MFEVSCQLIDLFLLLSQHAFLGFIQFCDSQAKIMETHGISRNVLVFMIMDYAYVL